MYKNGIIKVGRGRKLTSSNISGRNWSRYQRQHRQKVKFSAQQTADEMTKFFNHNFGVQPPPWLAHFLVLIGKKNDIFGKGLKHLVQHLIRKALKVERDQRIYTISEIQLKTSYGKKFLSTNAISPFFPIRLITKLQQCKWGVFCIPPSVLSLELHVLKILKQNEKNRLAYQVANTSKHFSFSNFVNMFKKCFWKRLAYLRTL